MADLEHAVWLTPEEAAGILRVSVWSVWKALKRGDVKGAMKLGGQWRIPRRAVMPNAGGDDDGPRGA